MAIFGVIALCIVLLIALLHAPRDWRGVRPLFSSYVIVLIGLALYILLPAVLIVTAGTYTWAVDYYSEETFAKTVWLAVLAVLAFLYGNALSRYRRPTAFITSQAELPLLGPTPQVERVLLLSFLLIGLALKAILIINTGGITDSVTRFSGFATQFTGVGDLDAGSIQLRTLSGIADGAATWGMLRALQQRSNEKLWLIIVVVILGLSYLTIGKRLILILPIVCILVGVHVFRRSITTRLLPLVLALAVGAGFLTISARAFLPASVVGYDVNLENSYAEGSMIQFYLYSLEFASLEMISVVMESGQDIIDMFGGTWDAFTVTNIQSFLYSIPRGLWPGKPSTFYDLSYGVSAALGATPFEDPTVGYASTLIGTSYLIAGIVGVLCSMFAIGLLTDRVDRRLTTQTWTNSSVVGYAIALVVVFHLFRQGTLGWTFIVSIVQQYGTIAAFLMLSLSSRSKIKPVQSVSKNQITL